MKEDERCTMFHRRVCPWSILLIITLILSLEASFVEGFTHHHSTSTTTTQTTTVLSHLNPTKLRSNSFPLNANNNNNDDNKDETEEDFVIRPAKFGEMGQVSNIIVSSFYKASPLIRPYLYLNELQRLQSNFPYSDPKHYVFVAIIGRVIVGFVDVDGRTSTIAKAPPRPYLSDLAVDPNYRRRGIAKALIQKCETVVQDFMNSKELYLRVERDNQPGLSMYDGLGYSALNHPVFGVEDTTILLKREFSSDTRNNNNNTTTNTKSPAEDDLRETNINTLDYVV